MRVRCVRGAAVICMKKQMTVVKPSVIYSRLDNNEAIMLASFPA
jgi:hypothetical protein